MKKKLTDQSLW